MAEEKWDPHSVDRFANHENTQLPRFNSRFWCPGTEAVDAFSVSWAGENNWLVPPIFLIPKVLNHMVALGGRATLVVPAWPSAPFWPFIFTNGGLSPIFSDIFEIPLGTDVFVLGNYKIPFLDHLIFVQVFCSCGFPREALVKPPLFFSLVGGFSLPFIEFLRSYHMVSEYFGMHLDPCFVDHLVFFIMQGPLWPLVVIFFCVFSWDHLDPTLPCFTSCCIFLIYFFFGHFCHFIFSIFCFRS